MKSKLVPLYELGEIVSGSTPDTTKKEYWDGDIPWITPADLTGHQGIFFTGDLRKITELGYKSCSTKIIPSGSILFSSRAPIGHCAVTTFPLCTNQGFKNLIPNNKLNPIYGYFALKYFTPQIESLGRGATFTEVNKELFENVCIPLPPLLEQQRIAAILQKADRLRRLRRYARQLSDGYLQSVFLEMFGDPVTNLKGFPKDLLGNVVRINPGIDRQIALNSKISFVPMMGVNEQTGKIIFSEERTFREVSKGYTPFIENDVLFAKITPCMENGKSAIASHLINGIGFGSTEFHVLRPTKLTTSEWIFWLIRKKEFRQLASKSFTGTAGQQRVPTSFLENFPVPIPPVALQNQFVEICKGYDQLLKRFIESERQTETLFQSLLQQAFQGEL